MRSWYKIVIGASDLAAGKAVDLIAEFMDLFIQYHTPRKMALFLDAAAAGEASGQSYYLNTAASLYCEGLIEKYGGRQCPEPHDPLHIRFVVGDVQAAHLAPNRHYPHRPHA